MEQLILFGIGLLLFSNSFALGYCVDDDQMVKIVKSNRELKWQGLPKWRIVDIYLYGAGFFRNAREEHIFTSILHYLTTCLIYTITGSFMAGLLYLVNPVFNQTSIWLNGRRYALAVILCLIGWKYPLLAPFAYTLAVWIHVIVAPFPLLFLTTPYWFWVPVCIALFILLGYERIKQRFLGRKSEFSKDNELQKLKPQKIIIYIKSVGFYFFHCLIPNKPRMYHEFLYYFSRYEWANKQGYSFNFEFWKGFLAIGFIAYEIIFQHNFWAFWFILFISQYCNIITVTQNAADRYLSMAGIGLMVILVKYINMLPTSYLHIAYSVIITFYLLRYFPLFRAYQNARTFHLYHINLQPDGVEPRTILATNYHFGKHFLSAYVLLKEGLHYRPNDFKLLIVMAQNLFLLGKYEIAVKTIERAEKNIPIGEKQSIEDLLAMKEQFIKAKEQQLKTISIAPNRAQKRQMEKAK